MYYEGTGKTNGLKTNEFLNNSHKTADGAVHQNNLGMKVEVTGHPFHMYDGAMG
jgi:hypothetical protein